MTTSMFDGIFAKAKAALMGNPRPVAVPVVLVPLGSAVPVAPAPQPIWPLPKRPDVEDIRLGFRFGMQEVRIGLHATGEAPAKIASLVTGR